MAELKAGAINHAIRFTAPSIKAAYAYPASHLVTGRESCPCGLSATMRTSCRSMMEGHYPCRRLLGTQPILTCHFDPSLAEESLPNSPWLGLRVRLRQSFDCNTLSSSAGKAVCAALKQYGAILADVGSAW